MKEGAYTTKLGAGLGLIPETEKLLDLWEPGMDRRILLERALESGEFPTVTARRLRNIVSEGFAPRYLVNGDTPASTLKSLRDVMSSLDRRQLLFLFTCRANAILADFVREVYWHQYAAGGEFLQKKEALDFVEHAVAEGRTTSPWSETMRTRVASYLLGACADFGLLGYVEAGARRVHTFRPTSFVILFLAHDLHFRGLSDSAVVNHEDWLLFGLEPGDVLAELKQIALSGHVIVQSAAGLVQISWKYNNIEELGHAVAHS